METCIQGDQKDFKKITTSTRHYGIALETLKKGEKEIMCLEDTEEDLTTFASIKKVHEVNNHKGADQLVSGYSKAGWMSPTVFKNIKKVLKDCRLCQKFAKSVSRPKVTLPKASSFNEIVTPDLKSF